MDSIVDGSGAVKRNGQEERGAFHTIYDLQQKVWHAQTTPRGKLVLTALVFHYNAQTGQCNPSHELLAAETGYSERTIRKILKEDLADLVTYQHGKHSNAYTLFPPMLVSSTADGQYPVAPAEPSLGTRGPGEHPRHSEPRGRFTRNTGAGSLGTRGPGNKERTKKEHSFPGQHQQQASPPRKPPKAQTAPPSAKAVQAAFQKRGFAPDRAKAEAVRFVAYNTAKGWKGDWQANVERWQPQAPGPTATEFKPGYHRAYEAPEVEDHTPAQQAANLSVLRNWRIEAAKIKRQEQRG